MKLRSILFVSFLVFSGNCNAGSLCSPKDNNARILSAPSPNAIDPQWSGGGFIGTGWSFYVTETVNTPTGVFAKGNLHGSRGGIAQAGVYVLLPEWNCEESGPEVTEGIERVDADPATATSTEPPPQPLPQIFSVLTEKGRHVRLLVRNFGRILPISKKFEGIKGTDSTNTGVRSYNMTYRIEPAERLPKEDGAVIGYEFVLPRIARGDRLIVNRRTERPYESAEGGVGYETIEAPWPFGASFSGSTRVLFTEFRGPQDMEHLGEWTSDLVVNGKTLVSRKFVLFDPSGKDHPNTFVDDNTAPIADTVPVDNLADLTGIWAHSTADCDVATSGKLNHASRAESAPYQLVGICGGGVELLYEAFTCEASNVSKAGDTLDVDTSCREKDYDPEKSHIHIKMENTDSLQFVDSAFTITGKYVRCGHNYFCSRQ